MSETLIAVLVLVAITLAPIIQAFILPTAHSVLDRPSSVQATRDGGTWKTRDLTAFRYCSAYATQDYLSVLPSVSRLHQRGRPSAISRFVVTVVVNPVERHAARSRSHVGQEGREVISPDWKHGYSASAIVVEFVMGPIKATASCLNPRVVLGRPSHAVRRARTPDFLVQASAASCSAADEISTTDQHNNSAFAPTVNAYAVSVQGRKASKNLAVHVLQKRHVRDCNYRATS